MWGWLTPNLHELMKSSTKPSGQATLATPALVYVTLITTGTSPTASTRMTPAIVPILTLGPMELLLAAIPLPSHTPSLPPKSYHSSPRFALQTGAGVRRLSRQR